MKKNAVMEKSADVFVVGSGAAGMAASFFCIDGLHDCFEVSSLLLPRCRQVGANTTREDMP